jgi:hypothetical protein
MKDSNAVHRTPVTKTAKRARRDQESGKFVAADAPLSELDRLEQIWERQIFPDFT